jgi:TonB family protein
MTTASVMVCGSCGTRVDATRSFCTSCGSSVFVEVGDRPMRQVSRPAVEVSASGLPLIPIVRLIVFITVVWFVGSRLMKVPEFHAIVDSLRRGERVNVTPGIDALRRWLGVTTEATRAPKPGRTSLPPTEPRPMPLNAPADDPRYPGAYLPGGDVTQPRLIRRVNPRYTLNALRRRIQGAVIVKGVVHQDGSISDVSVVSSLDAKYGLDEAAVRAVEQWRFTPGTKNGRPVPVVVTLEVRFSLR